MALAFSTKAAAEPTLSVAEIEKLRAKIVQLVIGREILSEALSCIEVVRFA